MAWGKAGSVTLDVNDDVISLTGFTPSKFSTYLLHAVEGSGTLEPRFRLNNDTSGHSNRMARDGDADTTAPSRGDWVTSITDASDDNFNVGYLCNIDGKEKLGITRCTVNNGTGYTTNPRRREVYSKYTDSGSNGQITRFDNIDTDTSALKGVGSNLTLLGSDLTPAETGIVPAIPSLMPSLESPSVGGWVEVGRISAGGSSKFNTVSSLADKRYYMVLGDLHEAGGGSLYFRFGDSGDGSLDSGNNYATRYHQGDAEANPLVSQPEMFLGTPHTQSFSVGYISNLPGKEKLSTNHMVRSNGTGTSASTQRTKQVGKWVNSTASNVIDTISHYNYTENWSADSETIVLGWDSTDTHTTNFWQELASVDLSDGASTSLDATITAKKYLWIQVYSERNTTGTHQPCLQFNGDTSSNYKITRSNDDGDDGYYTTNKMVLSWYGFTKHYTNSFLINRSGKEKLMITNDIGYTTAGAGTAPNRSENVSKWTGTDQITSIKLMEQDNFTYDTKTTMKIWGAD